MTTTLTTLDDVYTYLEQDSGDAPASRYGVSASQWRPVAVAVCDILAYLTGEPFTPEGVDHVAGLVVNDHDDPAYLLVTYGPECGFDPADFLNDDDIAAAKEMG